MKIAIRDMPDKNNNLPSSPIFPLTVKALALLAGLLWLMSLFGPAMGGHSGASLAGVALTFGWYAFPWGPWAAFANFTLPWAVSQLLRNRFPQRALWLTLVLPATSWAYWKLLVEAALASWGLWAWTASIVCLLLSGVIAKRYMPPAAPRRKRGSFKLPPDLP